MITTVKLLAIYSRTVVRQFSYVRCRTTSIPHHLLFTKRGAPTTGVNERKFATATYLPILL